MESRRVTEKTIHRRVRPESGLRRRFVKTILIWVVPLSLLLLAGGLIAELAGFFTLAALITFGGAYAVLPFVADAAVNRFGWLSADDMVAGLALGESTPGPLIMVNTFVGFMAGYNVEGGLAWGLVGATVAIALHIRPILRFHNQRRSAHRPHPYDRRIRRLVERDHYRRGRGNRCSRRVRRASRCLLRRSSRTGS